MNRALAWSVKGVGFDAREAAREAARRSGQTLGEWLNEVIAEQAAEIGVEPGEVDAATRLEAVAAKLARLNDRDNPARPGRRTERDDIRSSSARPDADTGDEFDGLRERLLRQSGNRQEDDREPASRHRAGTEDETGMARRASSGYRETAPAGRADPARMQRRSRRMDAETFADADDYRSTNLRDPEDLLTQAIEQFDHRARDAQKKTASALADVAHWIETSESRRENERDVLHKVTRKLDAIQQRVASRDDAGDNLALEALDKVVRRLDTIEDSVSKRAGQDQVPVQKALERLETRLEALARRPEPNERVETGLRDLETKIATLNTRLERNLGESQPASQQRGPVAANRPSLKEAVADIARRQRLLNDTAASFPQGHKAAPAMQAAPDPQAQALANLNQQMTGLTSQLEGMRSLRAREIEASARADRAPDPALARMREEIAEMSAGLSGLAPRGSVEALEAAMRDLGRRIETTRVSGAHEALLAPVEQLAGDLRTALRELDPRATVETLRREMQLIHNKLEGMTGRALDAQSIAPLQAQMQEIRDLVTQAAARPLPVETIERQIAALSDRIEKISRQNIPMGIVRGQQPDFSGIADNIRDVIDRALPRPALQQLENRLESLDAKINEAMSRNGHDVHLAELSMRMDDVHQALKAPVPAAAMDMQPFEAMMREISRKLEAPRQNEAAALQLKALESQVAQIAARLETATPGLSGDALSHFDTLAHSIDRLGKKVGDQTAMSGLDPSAMEETLRELARSLESARKPDASVQMIQSLAGQLAHIGEKIEHSSQGMWALTSNASTHFETLSKRIDAVQGVVARQLAEIQAATPQPVHTDVSALEDMVRHLADKIEAVRSDNPSAQAIESLEAQVKRMAERLEKSGAATLSLGSLENTVHDLFAQMQDTRHAALDAAETAARTAARDTLREAMMSGSALAGPELAREIAGIKSQQDAADRRTHSTLTMVHDTLERVVDRISSLEQDVAVVRSEDGPARPAAALSAPVWESGALVQERTIPFENRTAKAAALPPVPAAELSGLPRPGAADGRLPSIDDLDDDDFLIEPGNGPSRYRTAIPAQQMPDSTAGVPARGDKPAQPDAKGDLPNFIAAARRLQQVQPEAAVAASAPVRGRVSSRGAVPSRSKPLLKARDYLVAHKRPALVIAASLMLVLGTVEAIRIFGLAGTTGVKSSEQIIDTRRAQNPPLEVPANSAPRTPDVPVAPREGASLDTDAGKTRSTGVDATPVGAIANALASTGPGPARPDMAADTEGALLQVASSGNAAAQYEMAIRLGEGRGMPRDVTAAAAWFDKAASQDLAPAQYRLGSMYEKGMGVSRDPAQAKAWYLRAANNGNVRAMHNLAVLTADGGDGKPDYAGAANWFAKAAEFGVRDSQYNLAVLYARGLGVTKDLPKSLFWFTLAANQGDADAATKRGDVTARLDNKQLDAVQADVAAFKPGKPVASGNDVQAPPEGWDAIAQQLPPRNEPAKPDAGKAAAPRVNAKLNARPKLPGFQ